MPYARRIVETLAGCISGNCLVVIPSVTHFMSYQEPDMFNEAVLRLPSRGGRRGRPPLVRSAQVPVYRKM